MIGNRESLTVITPPATEPVALATAKDFLRVTGSDDDGAITLMIQTAREWAESYTRRAFINRTLRLTLDYFPQRHKSEWWDGVKELPITELYGDADYIELPLPPLVSVASITTYDDANAASVYSASNYYVDTAGGRVHLVEGQIWPTDLRNRAAVEVQYVAGYGANVTDVPAQIRQGILATVNHLYNNRDCIDMPVEVKKMLDAYRVVKVPLNG